MPNIQLTWYKLYKVILEFSLEDEPSLQPVIEKCKAFMSEKSLTLHSPTKTSIPGLFPDETVWCNLSMLFDLYITGSELEHAPELAPARQRLQTLTLQRQEFYSNSGQESPPDMINSFVRQFL